MATPTSLLCPLATNDAEGGRPTPACYERRDYRLEAETGLAKIMRSLETVEANEASELGEPMLASVCTMATEV
eukprot:12908045-Prorocentrum_lima.AAC.1